MSRTYFIELYDMNGSLMGKFKYLLNGKSVKEVRELIIERLIGKNQIGKDDMVVMKDNDQYQLASDDQVNDVVVDGKVKLFVVKNGQGNQLQQVQQGQQGKQIQQTQQAPQLQQLQQVQTNQPSLQPQQVQQQPQQAQSYQSITPATLHLGLSNFTLPQTVPTDKNLLKIIIPQIRKSLIQIPIREQFQNFKEFSDYIIKILGLSPQLKAILYNSYGCPYLFNLDLSMLEFPKLEFSQVYYVVITKTVSACDRILPVVNQAKNNMELIKLVNKTNQLSSIDIKFQIDLSNPVSVLRHRIYTLTKILPQNQILKFGTNVLLNDLQPISTYGIKKDSIIELSFKLNSNLIPSSLCDKFFYKDVQLMNEQTNQSVESFRCNIIVLAEHLKQQDRLKFLLCLEKYSQNLPMVFAIKVLLEKAFLSQASRIALEEGLYGCVLNYIKSVKNTPKVLSSEVFMYLRDFLGYIFQSMSKFSPTAQQSKSYQQHNEFVRLKKNCTFTLKPIKTPSIITIDNGETVLVDYDQMLEQINKGFTFDRYKKPQKEHLKRSGQLDQVWRWYGVNHLDNEDFESLWWFGTKKQPKIEGVTMAMENVQQITQYTNKVDSYQNLNIHNPLQLKNKSQAYLLLKTKENNLRVFVSKNKDISKPYNLFNPITGNEDAVNLDLMSGAINTENTQVQFKKQDLKPIITRDPKEAIVIVFDISGSMGCKFFNEPDLSRIGAVKSFFEAFAYRTVAYNLEHVVELIFFDNKIQKQCDFTEAIFDFNRLISGAHPRGSTRLFDSIVLGAHDLIAFRNKYPDCKLRILALTDGEDNSSTHSYADTAKILFDNHITIDSFAVGTGCDGLKNVTLASGGKCYLARNLEESLKLFEQETVLSVRSREEDQSRKNVSFEEMLAKVQYKPFDQINSVHKFKMPEIKASGKNVKDISQMLKTEENVKKYSTNGCMKRLVKQIQNYTKNPHPFISIYPAEDLKFWKILLVGPKETPYQNGLFLLYAKFPNDYPFKAPEVRFITPIYHCNMNSQGRICHSVFDRNYSPVLSFKQIMDCVYGLILTPEPEDPLDNVVASFYLSDYQTYLKNAKTATMTNASHSMEKLVEQLYGKITDDIERQKKVQEIQTWIEEAKKNN